MSFWIGGGTAFLAFLAFFWVLEIFFLRPLLEELVRLRGLLEVLVSDTGRAETQRGEVIEKLQYVLNYLGEWRRG